MRCSPFATLFLGEPIAYEVDGADVVHAQLQ